VGGAAIDILISENEGDSFLPFPLFSREATDAGAIPTPLVPVDIVLTLHTRAQDSSNAIRLPRIPNLNKACLNRSTGLCQY